ncbi:MAG: HlyC/CorC family transporter [Chloroflexi bacterium]|uniref:hemolysin family protein n=1 Tax=Candidatus Flexifilum breve TaxID=3140694 RepID=UPI0031366365|nr:HlyC/CorC family transporter [Chloroflexota bacterium]
MSTVLGLLGVLALVFMNGFFVAAEFAFVGSRKTRIAQMAQEGSAGAKSAQKAIEHLDSYIAATQLGITLASLGLGWIGEPAIAHLFEPIFERFLTEDAALTVGRTISVAISFAIVTTLHIVLGELAPKSIALNRPEEVSVIVARGATLFHNVFRPIIRVMNGVGNAVVRLIGIPPASGHQQVHSAEELEMLVHSSREAGLLQESEEVLLRRVFDFSEISVEEIMQPRVEIDAVDVATPLADLLALMVEQHHSRYPVYDDHIDNMIGVLYVKDLFDVFIKQPTLLNGGASAFDLRPLLRKPLYVPMTLGVDKLLEDMRRTQTHLAIVIDEYGGVAGLATLDDILAELVGELSDEFDERETPVLPADQNIVDGLESMTAIIERFGEPGIEVESTTIGGYVAERLERIPLAGDTVAYGEAYDVVVLQMDGMRVSEVRFVPSTRAKPDVSSADTDA